MDRISDVRTEQKPTSDVAQVRRKEPGYDGRRHNLTPNLFLSRLGFRLEREQKCQGGIPDRNVNKDPNGKRPHTRKHRNGKIISHGRVRKK